MSDASTADLRRLEADGVLRRVGDRWRTTARWQAAMMRAAVRLRAGGDAGGDLRVPVATALCDLYGEAVSDAELARLVEVVTPVEALELVPLVREA